MVGLASKIPITANNLARALTDRPDKQRKAALASRFVI